MSTKGNDAAGAGGSKINVATSKPVFGSSCKRFGTFTLHPNLDAAGSYVKWDKGCDPCRYNPKSIHEVFKLNKRATKDPWLYKAEMEAWSQNLGYRNQRVLAQRRWQASLLGPAWTQLPPDRPCYEPACKNITFGRTPRFRSSKASAVPGPGTYFHEPLYRAPYGPHSSRSTFEREEACRFKDRPSVSVACTRYRIIDYQSIEMKPKKIVSLRGPYDLFSGKRDGPIHNHFAKPKQSTNKTWPMAFPGSLERFKTTHLGEMNRTGRDKPPRNRLIIGELALAIRKPEEPGPQHYDVDKPRQFKKNMYGFNSSRERQLLPRGPRVWPGVGRYNVRRPRMCGIPGQGHRHVFLSKVQRKINGIQEPMNNF